MLSPSQQIYDQSLRRVHDAQWLLDHVDEEHRVELCLRVPLCGLIHWVRGQRRPVDIEQLRTRMDVSRASAYRMRTALFVAGERVVAPAQNERQKPLLPMSPAAAFIGLRSRSAPVRAFA